MSIISREVVVYKSGGMRESDRGELKLSEVDIRKLFNLDLLDIENNEIDRVKIVNAKDIKSTKVFPTILKNRYEVLMDKGTNKYDSENWKLGLSSIRCIDGIFRHLLKYYLGDTSEDHLAAIVFNVIAIMQVESLVDKDVLSGEYLTFFEDGEFSNLNVENKIEEKN